MRNDTFFKVVFTGAAYRYIFLGHNPLHFLSNDPSSLPTRCCDPLDSRLLSRLERPVGRFNTELLGVLRVQPLPAELHRLATNDAADGSSAEKAVQNIETHVPPGSAHCDEAAIDVGPQR